MEGILTDLLTCRRCGGSAHDFLREDGKQWVLQCVFCSDIERLANPPKKPEPAPPARQRDQDEFRFQFGRFAGLTIAEADAQPRGREYLEFMLSSNDKLRPRIEEYLARTA